MPWSVRRVRGAGGDHLAGRQHVHLVGQLLGLVHRVRRQYDGDAVLAQVADQLPDLAARRAGPGRWSARPGTRSPAARRSPAPARAAASARPTAAGTASCRTSRGRAARPAPAGRAGARAAARRTGASRAPGRRTRRRPPAASRRSAASARRGRRSGRARAPGPCPESGSPEPLQVSTVVVLPAPLGPSTDVTVPPVTVRVRPSTAAFSPYRTTRLSISTATGTCAV